MSKKIKAIKKKKHCELRVIIESKLKWAESEKLKGIKTIETIKNQMLKLEGVILILNQLLNPPKEEKK